VKKKFVYIPLKYKIIIFGLKIFETITRCH